MNVTVLVGGVGGARFLQGVQNALGIAGGESLEKYEGPHRITAVVNVGDDVWMHGLRICPDLDTCMYTLGGGIDTERGWGTPAKPGMRKNSPRTARSRTGSASEIAISQHLIRSQMLRTGYPLSAITEALCNRWNPGVALLPVSDDRSETHVVITDPEDGEQKAIHFQEWWVRHRAQVETHSFAHVGAEQAKPAPGVVEAIDGADIVLIAPSIPS
ncbi:2-phospho-L-lactate transferase CofD family protein [Rhodococcus sp. 3Y1]